MSAGERPSVLTGGCMCGAIRYHAAGRVFHQSLCHCSDCRRATGAPVVAWFSVASADYHVLAGTPVAFASSPGAERSFCGTCGTPLTFRLLASPDEIDITTGSLDDPDLVPPEDHTRSASHVGWWDRLGALPHFETTRQPSAT